MSALRLQQADKTLQLDPGSRHFLPLTGAARSELFEQASAAIAGPHGWLPSEGGLIGNLRVWENCLLPLSYFTVPPCLQDEARFARLLDSLSMPETDRQAFAAAPAGSLSGRQRRLACALRTLMARPALIMVESEWFGRLDESDAQHLRKAFEAECPRSCWLALGRAQPAEQWGFVNGNTETSHDAVA